jgi:hypothetical protein
MGWSPASGASTAICSPPPPHTAPCSYDHTVLAGTCGLQNYRKKDRMFDLIERRHARRLFTEGGWRTADTDAPGVAALDCMAFHRRAPALWC